MKKIKIIIARGKDNYGAYAENVEMITGEGNTVREAKESALNSIEIIKAFGPEYIPEVLKGDYEIVWKLDVESLLDFYKGIFNQTGIAKLTGINEKQLNHYASGLKKPRAVQIKKIEAALHRLGSELLSVEL